jgi:two-component system sensor histidine kinase RegB
MAVLSMRQWPADTAGRKNMALLVQLRWLAVAGQLVTILVVEFGLGIELPLAAILVGPATAILLNLASLALLRRRDTVSNGELFLALLFDVGSLTVQLYLSGGATNPFVSLYLLQVVLGAILLDAWSSWAIVAITSLCSALLTVAHQPLALPPQLRPYWFVLDTIGALACFVLVATLLVLFIARISGNLRARDAHLADMRQQAAEEDHIVRMGLLASGAAHELGTPLSSLAVILSDWRRMPALAGDAELQGEIAEMQAEVQRCKAIVTGILLSAGEARGEGPEVTSVHAFLDRTVADWRAIHPVATIDYKNRFGSDLAIVSDPVLRQVVCNVLDNALEASPRWIGVTADGDDRTLCIAVEDAGPGFTPAMLVDLGKPYRSSKAQPGHGLGLFLVCNVMRKLGGTVTAANRAEGGAVVTLSLPLAALAIESAEAA